MNVIEMSDLQLNLNEFDKYLSSDPMNNIFNYDRTQSNRQLSGNLIDQVC